MNTTLENLGDAVRINRYRNFAENMVKYQNFKTSAIIPKIDNFNNASRKTLESYINSCVYYIKSGKKYHSFSHLYKYIDEALKKHIQPLTPSSADKRITHKITKKKIDKDLVLPVNKVIDEINKKSKAIFENELNKNKFYAVKIDKNIVLQDNLSEAQGFKKGCEFVGAKDVKLVNIRIMEV